MSLKRRIHQLEKRRCVEWEAPWFITISEEDATRVCAEIERYREEIERDKARGRTLFGVDFRHCQTNR